MTIQLTTTAKVGDIGLELVVTLQTKLCADTLVALDVSGATTKEICLISPDQTNTSYTAIFATCGTSDGTDGKIAYTTADATILDTPGVWTIAAKIIQADGSTFRSSSATFVVETGLCA